MGKHFNKESILAQIKIVKDNVSRLEILVEADMIWSDKKSKEVPVYCCLKAQLQLENIQKEITGEPIGEPYKFNPNPLQKAP